MYRSMPKQDMPRQDLLKPPTLLYWAFDRHERRDVAKINHMGYALPSTWKPRFFHRPRVHNSPASFPTTLLKQSLHS